MSNGGGEWTVTAVYRDSAGRHMTAADIELRFADSFATGWHFSHLGQALQNALREAKVKLDRQKLAFQKKGRR